MVQIHSCCPLPLLLTSLCASWGKRAAHNRAQIVYYIAENLELRRAEVAQRINTMKGTLSAVCIQKMIHAFESLIIVNCEF